DRAGELVPRAGALVRHVKQTPMLGLQQRSNLNRKVRRVRWRYRLIVDDLNRVAAFRFSQHGLDKVATLALTTGDAVQTASANQDVLLCCCSNQSLARQLRVRVDAQWERFAPLGVGLN